MERKMNKRRLIGWLVLASAAALMLLGGVYAKYVTTQMDRAEMLSSSFHFSSNYLEEEAPSYQVSDMHSISFEIYNYEKTNVASISDQAITYEIKTDGNWGVKVQDSEGNEVKPDKQGRYEMPVTGKTVYHVTVFGGSQEQPVTVTAKTLSPYSLELKGTFKPSSQEPAYEVRDAVNHCTLTIRSNDYQGPVSITWNPANLSPDNLNPYMAQWQDASPSQILTVQKNTVYELLFVKNQNVSITNQDGTGTSVTIE